MLIKKVCVVVAVLAGMSVQGAGSASALMYCSRPSKPYCVTSLNSYSTRDTFDRCRNEIEAYFDRDDDYVRCLRDEMDDVNDEANELVDQFNCKAQGNNFCY